MDTLVYNGHAPFVAGSDTSKEAAVSVNSKTKTVRDRVLSFITARPLGGATQDEVSRKMGIPHQSASARIRELVLMGKLNDTGIRRLTQYGKPARVYKAAA